MMTLSKILSVSRVSCKDGSSWKRDTLGSPEDVNLLKATTMVALGNGF